MASGKTRKTSASNQIDRLSRSPVFKEIERQSKIAWHCAVKRPQEIRAAYLQGWLDAEQISGRKANPDKFHTLMCDCGHRKQHHEPNKVRQEAGYAVCWIVGCKCNKEW